MIEEKEQYTFEELCEGLEISMSKFAKLANVDEGTIARLRKGQFGRIGTINRLLRVFSEIYGRKFTLDNVTGLKRIEKPIAPIADKTTVLPKQETKPADMVQTTSPLLPSTIANSSMSAQVTTKRGKSKGQTKKKTNLPDGCILATEFAANHGIVRETFRDHMNNGIGPGLIHGPDVPEDGSVKVKDYVRYEERNKRIRKDGTIEKERYLTTDQQHAALNFWKRHDVDYSVCTRIDCWCHTVKNGG